MRATVVVLVVLMQAFALLSVTPGSGCRSVNAPTTPRVKFAALALGLYVPVRPLPEASAAVVPVVSSSFQYSYGE